MNDKVGKAAKLKNSGNQGNNIDVVLWIIVLLLVGAGVYGNSYFAAESVLYRTVGLLVLAAVAAYTASRTAKGKAFMTLCMEARTEIRKVVWPTRTETTQTTLIVVVVVIIVALILWALDSLLSWVISLFIG
ncbi:MAG: preprotein translocase subunit SecE [Gammaproteobacteria bacterium]|nr:preprotein translocase subunit SecE [Gammaproteobacteria bacterium]MAY02378.1 preprotein translocase subunit SecE [Gammaproteobacteria bacterium]|tara:strand:- start:51517 stop:51912 length:396 start_codon:yes stop_codon:yes gene_type:complete